MIDRGLLVGTLTASLVGSVHCAAMCGPFACVYAAPGMSGERPRGEWLSHAAYNGGRLVSYLTLGAVAGMIGFRLDDLGRLRGMEHLAALLAGTLIVAWALAAIASHAGLSAAAFVPEWSRRAVTGVLTRIRSHHAVSRALVLGLVTTLLPCGWLYVFVLVAGGTGHAADGAVTMLAFWAGTLPMMIAVGYSVRRFAGPFARRLPLLSAALVLVLGVFAVVEKFRVSPDAMVRTHVGAASHTHAMISHDGR